LDLLKWFVPFKESCNYQLEVKRGVVTVLWGNHLLLEVKRNVYLLGITSFLNDASSEGVYALLPLYLKDPALVGLVGGLFNGLAYMIKPFSGYLSDRIGRTKPLIIFGYLFSATVRSFIALVSRAFVPLLVALDRIGKGIRDAPRDVLLATVKNRGWAFGLHRALDTSGAVLGTLLAATLVYFLDIRLSILLLAFLGFLTLLPLLLVKDVKRRRTEDSLTTSLTESARELGTTALLALLLGLSLVSPAIFIERAVNIVGKKGLVFYVIFNVIYALSAYYLGRKSDKLGRKTVMGLGLVSTILALLLVSTTHSILVLAGFVLFGVAFGTTLPVLFAMAGDRVKRDVGAGMGLVQFLLGTSMLISSTAAGLLVSLYGYFTLSLFATPAILATILLPRLT
jgi:MFS family permease